MARLGFWFTGYHSATSVLVWLTLITAIFMMTNSQISAMIADTVEDSCYHTGKRCAAMTVSGQTFTDKLSVAVASGASGLLLSLSGYIPNTTQTPSTLNSLFFCVALLPAIGALLRIVIMSKYKFTEDEHAVIKAALRKGVFHPSVTGDSETPEGIRKGIIQPE